jgi:hypothetical protein
MMRQATPRAVMTAAFGIALGLAVTPASGAPKGPQVDCAVNPAHQDCVNRTGPSQSAPGSRATAPGQDQAPYAATPAPKSPEPQGGENKPGHGSKGGG